MVDPTRLAPIEGIGRIGNGRDASDIAFSGDGTGTSASTAVQVTAVGAFITNTEAGHTNIRTTQRYIEANPDAQVRIVELV
jgi:hypothetical protein